MPLAGQQRPAGPRPYWNESPEVRFLPTMRDEPNRLRDQATRLLALALTSRERGQVEYSEHLTEAASEMLLRAEQIERSIRDRSDS
jgi:hypothetical protein